jgi:hypothetical protein
MHTKDPKEFWEILIQGKLKTRPNISLQNWIFQIAKSKRRGVKSTKLSA